MKTIRQQIIDLLVEEELDVRDISQAVSVREKEVYDHLEHIARTLGAQKAKLIITPYACLSCGYEFKDRKRFSRPGRCPECKNSHIEAASYRVINEKKKEIP